MQAISPVQFLTEFIEIRVVFCQIRINSLRKLQNEIVLTLLYIF